LHSNIIKELDSYYKNYMIKNETQENVGSVGLLKPEASVDAVQVWGHGFNSQGMQFLKIFTQARRGDSVPRFKPPV